MTKVNVDGQLEWVFEEFPELEKYVQLFKLAGLDQIHVNDEEDNLWIHFHGGTREKKVHFTISYSRFSGRITLTTGLSVEPPVVTLLEVVRL
jgi:hypothetical protein